MVHPPHQLVQQLSCTYSSCNQTFKSQQGCMQHINSKHMTFTSISHSQESTTTSPAADSVNNDEDPFREPTPMDAGGDIGTMDDVLMRGTKNYHPYLNGTCFCQGDNPPTPLPQPENPGAPFEDPVEMSQGNIDELMELWTSTMLKHNDFSPFENHAAMHKIINQIEQGDAPWKCFVTQVDPNLPANAPSWQHDKYQIWYRDPNTMISHILASRDFLTTKIYLDNPAMEGAMYVGIILGSDKTTVSIATGNVEYHPLYISIGNIFNSARHAHCNAIIPIGFLAIHKGDRKHDDDAVFHVFKKQLYHTSIAVILQSLKPAITQPVLLAGIVSSWCVKCTALSTDLDGEGGHRTQELTELLLGEYGGGDGQVLWFNYGIDENICPFTFDFPCMDIHQILMSDLLHQVIKGSFKDHLVEWTGNYLVITEGKERAQVIMDDIDHRFPHGCCFKQWMGDDLKALMKVYLPAVADYLPEEMTQCLASFLDFCYLVRHADFDEDTLDQVDAAITKFHLHHNIFITTGVRDSISLPRQHSLVHYQQHILDFGAPNGFCSSITDQMLMTNQRLDKLTTLHAELASFGLVTHNHPPPPDPFDIESEDAGAVDEPILAEVKLAVTKGELLHIISYLAYILITSGLEHAYPQSLERLAVYTHHPELPSLMHRFLYDQLHGDMDLTSEAISLEDFPEIMSHIYVYHSAIASFYAPSDISGVRGMRCEQIRSTPSWHRCPCQDCAFVVEDDAAKGFSGMSVVCILLLFSFVHDDITYPCALQVVKPETAHGNPVISVVHLDTILHGVHLLPVYGSHPIPHKFDYAYTLDCFRAFYVNKYADHHTNEIIFS
ncbi:hypothetical protein ARMGADRAFT_1048097 [Armillaria gallica]|uniref:C2H2-type domain-containing protein n=1 Tax=Armillaria gallica TaxID=47427 RepID=A0A2H3D832_ARMGA|nr:hypothetical protein ARMGADRAFT_1048097 [Armillaria gallica]